ncbi:MAG: hypothetical protein FD153_645 [Rhodospirillaceae bacterium]|nr:MAG: hypothetical protein FD153_645 [Rhodospirillaceae bacterium]
MTVAELESLYIDYSLFIRPRARMREVAAGTRQERYGHWFLDYARQVQKRLSAGHSGCHFDQPVCPGRSAFHY